ncbi:MAG: PhzF family phenazine biosynthesis protein [Desulfobacter sp.]|nr:MAG: PhzF family phenazine biosynthesis protein [Desulfobacter sp.]
MKCELVDVFADQRLSGNGLTIFSEFGHLTAGEMLAWTREMRQFESIFLRNEDGRFSARIFTMEEELDFAGHPLLGLAYHLHNTFGSEDVHQWQVQLNQQAVTLESRRVGEDFLAAMHQGKPRFIKTLSSHEAGPLYSALNLEGSGDLGCRAEVVSTGLPYVILPVAAGIEKVRFRVPDLTPMISPHGAKFVYVLDVKAIEGRSWDNEGRVEDIATGSAAGPAAAYLFKHGLVTDDRITIHQGRFLGRPSEMGVGLACRGSEILDIEVSGKVVKVADIRL